MIKMTFGYLAEGWVHAAAANMQAAMHSKMTGRL
jgi:hypothetical protein